MSEIADQCPQPVYGEFSVPVDPSLFRIIARFTAEDVDVRVYHVETMTDEGADLSPEMSDEEFFGNAEAHTEKIIQECDVSMDNTLLLVRAADDKYLDIVTAGEQTVFKEDHRREFDKITDRYFDDAKSGGISHTGRRG